VSQAVTRYGRSGLEAPIACRDGGSGLLAPEAGAWKCSRESASRPTRDLQERSQNFDPYFAGRIRRPNQPAELTKRLFLRSVKQSKKLSAVVQPVRVPKAADRPKEIAGTPLSTSYHARIGPLGWKRRRPSTMSCRTRWIKGAKYTWERIQNSLNPAIQSRIVD
jgi:hypothetical protein